MALDQTNEELNDAIQTYFPKRSRVGQFFYLFLTSLTVRLMHRRRLLFSGKRLMNERIIEHAQMLQWIRHEGRVLDVGCVSSRLPLHLASLGYQVYGVDLSDYGPVKHPNFHFNKKNIFEWVPPVKFDVVILLSTLEHIGLGAYGDAKSKEGDKKAVELLSGWLVDRGQILVSVPFGKGGETSKHRIYDSASLDDLFPASKFRRVHDRYFKRTDGSYSPSTKDELANVSSPDLPVNGVAILDLEKIS